MKNVTRKAVIHFKQTEKKVLLTGVFRDLAVRTHRHVCSNSLCRLLYEDVCTTPHVNGRCRPCRGLRRTWVDEETGLLSLDPRPCCRSNTKQVVEPESLLRFHLAGPGPWYQCLTCARTHGHPCTDSQLLAQPVVVHNQRGNAHV